MEPSAGTHWWLPVFSAKMAIQIDGCRLIQPRNICLSEPSEGIGVAALCQRGVSVAVGTAFKREYFSISPPSEGG